MFCLSAEIKQFQQIIRQFWFYLRMLFPSKFTHRPHKNLIATDKFQPQKFIHDEYGCSQVKLHSDSHRLNSTNDSKNSHHQHRQQLIKRFYELKSIQSEMSFRFTRYLEKLEKELVRRESSNVQLCGEIYRVKGEIHETREDIKKIRSYAMSNGVEMGKESEYGRQKNGERKRWNYGLRRCWDELNF